MFRTYRSEDNPRFDAVRNKIAQFMSEKLGVEVSPELVSWKACENEYSLYSAISEPDNIEIHVKKTGETLEVVDS